MLQHPSSLVLLYPIFVYQLLIVFFWMWFDHTGWLVCNLQGGLLMFGLCASLMWGFMIGCYMFLALYRDMEIEQIDRWRYLFHIVAWGYGCFGALVPVIAGQYGIMYPGSDGKNRSFCWIADSTSFYRLILYIPDTAIFFLLIILYGLIQYHLRSTKSYIGKMICKRMSIYLLTYAAINLFAIVNRVQNYIISGDNIYALYLLQFGTQLLQGFLNAFAYAWNEPAFVDNYKGLFMKFKHRKNASSKSKVKNLNTPTEQTEKDRLMSYVLYDTSTREYFVDHKT